MDCSQSTQVSHSSDLCSLCWTLWLLPQTQQNMSCEERTGGSPEVLWSHGERTEVPALLKLSLQNNYYSAGKRVGSEILTSVSWSRTLLQSSSLTVLISLGTQICKSNLALLWQKEVPALRAGAQGSAISWEHSATRAGMQRNSGTRPVTDTGVKSAVHCSARTLGSEWRSWIWQFALGKCTKCWPPSHQTETSSTSPGGEASPFPLSTG